MAKKPLDLFEGPASTHIMHVQYTRRGRWVEVVEKACEAGCWSADDKESPRHAKAKAESPIITGQEISGSHYTHVMTSLFLLKETG